MIRTDYHAKYAACELTRRHSADNVEKLAGTLVDAQVDLNPHQVDAALFAFRSPLSRGAILADEVGLGKTIEAGLVISQRWAERKRRILVITPSNLRKQWLQELEEKFFLPCRILETKSYNQVPRYTLGELADGFDKKLRPLLRVEQLDTSGQVTAAHDLYPLIAAATADASIRNQVGAHFNPDAAGIADVMIRQFGENVVKLADALLCDHCRQLPRKNKSGSYLECGGGCGKMRLYPLTAPGQDPKGLKDL